MIRVNLLKAEAKTVEKKGAGAQTEIKAEKAKKSNLGNLIIFAIIVVDAIFATVSLLWRTQ